MTRVACAVYPNRGLASLALGGSLYEILNKLKANPKDFSEIDLVFSSTDPLGKPVLVCLANNGLRLRFDGAEQRLRLIEVLDFNKIQLTYNGGEILRASGTSATSVSEPTGPSYRAVTRLFGPTFPGEYLPPYCDFSRPFATYILSYPGIAFSFPLDAKAWTDKKDTTSFLSSSSTEPAVSMAIFNGSSWREIRDNLFKPQAARSRPRAASTSACEVAPDEVAMARIHGEGRIELCRNSGSHFWIQLSETTPQDLISELGPPDAIYPKHDRRLSIHRTRPSSRSKDGSAREEQALQDDPAMSLNARDSAEAEHFYNYFRFGFDVLIASPTAPSAPSPTLPESKTAAVDEGSVFPKNVLAATKMIFHGNVPGCRSFQRYRRCQWTLEHVPTAKVTEPLTSEHSFPDISERLQEVFSGLYASEEEAKAQQRGMTLDRSSIDSPGSSCELLGGPEEDIDYDTSTNEGKPTEQGVLNTSELFGFPGMIFEVLNNGAISSLTVY